MKHQHKHFITTFNSVVDIYLYECDRGDHTFKEKYSLMQDLLTHHTKEKSYASRVCQKVFAIRELCNNSTIINNKYGRL
jgi:hypothetical protein